MKIETLPEPKINRDTLMYRNPLGITAGKNKFVYGAVFFAVAVALTVFGVYYLSAANNVELGILLVVGAIIYLAYCGKFVFDGIGLLKRPFAVIIDGDNLILRRKHGYLHLPLGLMRRLTVDCEGVETCRSINLEGEFDVLIKGDNLYFSIGGEQENVVSRNMQKVAFVLSGIALGLDGINWGERYDELLLSEEAHHVGAAAVLSNALHGNNSQ